MPSNRARQTIFLVRRRRNRGLVAIRRRRRLWELRRSARSWRLFHELTMDSEEPALQHAIATISQSDPLIKLLQQVQQGRMKPTDAGLRAIIESWLEIYRKTVATEGLSRRALARIDPTPRIGMLIETGMVTSDHPAVAVLHREFEKAVALARN